MTTPALEIDQLDKSYGKHAVLNALSLTVAPGETFGLVGMNGAGKTTAIKCVLDFCEVDRGTIRIAGIGHRDAHARRPLAYLPENFQPPHFLSGREFIRYMQALRAQAYDDAATQRLLEALDFDPAALGRAARAYSKGMTQKLGLAACFVSSASLFILDEPMSGLDPKARAQVKRQFALLRESGKTLFFNSHLLADVEEICDRMAILHAGNARYVGSPAACRAHYAADTLEQAYLACIA